jgi:peptidyl-prolyl cis-trans isomerase C
MKSAALLRTLSLATAVLASCVLLTGCGQREPATPAVNLKSALLGAPDGPVVAVVNGETVTQPVFDLYARGRGFDPDVAEQRQQALDSLIENILLAQTLLASEAAQRPEVQAEAALVRMQQLSGRQLNSFRSSIEVPEQDVQDFYQREVERTGKVEYNAQHLLFTDPAEAARALAEATAEGADFSALISRYEGVAPQARDLGWANLSQLPAEFAEVLAQLEDGEVAPVLVQTSFGLHVLRRVGKRDFTPPPFAQVSEGVRQQLVNQALADRVHALRTTAQITAPGSSIGAAASSTAAEPPATAPAE